MNALAHNAFTESLNQMNALCPDPRAILVVSAHWTTHGSRVTAMDRPRTIYDFGNFPDELYRIAYPAPGDPKVAERITQVVRTVKVEKDLHSWGLDHGSWTVLRHVFPEAKIPVLQLSIDLSLPPERHFEIGKDLAVLREDNILIVASGNIVHNLGLISWDESASPYPWAAEFDRWVKESLVKRDFKALLHTYQEQESGRLSVPTEEHYFPLFYILGASDPSDTIDFRFEGIQNRSISMRTFALK